MNDVGQTNKMAGYQVDSAERAPGERWITMSNALVRAGHGLALSEKRLIAIAISKLDSVKVPTPGARVPRISITATEYAELAAVASSAAYEALEKAGTALMRDAITMFEPAWLRRKKKTTKESGEKPVVVKMPWVITSKYVPNEARIEMEFHPDVVPFLLGLKKQFTSYQLKQTSTLRSVYSWRLLELLSRFKTNGWAEYSIEDFKISMDVPDGLSDFSQINRRVIGPAIKELEEKDGWKIELELIKGGKRVKALRFKFERDPQGRFEGFDDVEIPAESVQKAQVNAPEVPPKNEAPAPQTAPYTLEEIAIFERMIHDMKSGEWKRPGWESPVQPSKEMLQEIDNKKKD